MPLTTRPSPYVVPSYSLTGDLLAYLQCGLQYRYQNRGALPPSKPVQLWFGQFIHGVLEEAYREWKQQPVGFPWNGHQIDPICLRIIERLDARGITFQRFALLGIAIERAYVAINEVGPLLFPLIAQAEVRLQGIRTLPANAQTSRQSRYYEVAGVVDVLTSITVDNAPPGNQLAAMVGEGDVDAYEVIVDYKGMGRPRIAQGEIDSWRHHAWQVHTYSWLRGQQPDSLPVKSGLLVYINELVPSAEDMEELVQQALECQPACTDVVPTGADLDALRQWRRDRGAWRQVADRWTDSVREWWMTEGNDPPFPRMPAHPHPLSMEFRRRRALRLVSVDEPAVQFSLTQFDGVVGKIEESVLHEIEGTVIPNAWEVTPRESTCTVCDFRKFCPADGHNFAGPPKAP